MRSFIHPRILIGSLFCLLTLSTLADGEAPSGVLVYSALYNGKWCLWRCRADGKEARQLTDGSGGEDADPRWSPDGKRLAFTRFRDGTPGIWIMACDSGTSERVCEGQQPSWTPEGKDLLFCRDGQVILRNLASGKEKRLSPEMWEQCSFPGMSADQTRVVCSSRHEGVIGLYFINLADGATTRLATTKEACTPRWSPDGKKILFQTSNHVCLISADGKDEDDLTFGAGIQHQGQFSPDGAWIVYTRGNRAEGPWSLCLLNLVDGNERPFSVEGSIRYPDWRKEKP